MGRGGEAYRRGGGVRRSETSSSTVAPAAAGRRLAHLCTPTHRVLFPSPIRQPPPPPYPLASSTPSPTIPRARPRARARIRARVMGWAGATPGPPLLCGPCARVVPSNDNSTLLVLHEEERQSGLALDAVASTRRPVRYVPTVGLAVPAAVLVVILSPSIPSK